MPLLRLALAAALAVTGCSAVTVDQACAPFFDTFCRPCLLSCNPATKLGAANVVWGSPGGNCVISNPSSICDQCVLSCDVPVTCPPGATLGGPCNFPPGLVTDECCDAHPTAGAVGKGCKLGCKYGTWRCYEKCYL